DRSAIADLVRLAGSVPPGGTPDIAPGPAAGCADGGGFGVWLPLWSCIPAACPVPDAGNVRTAWGRIPSQPPTTRQMRTFAPRAPMHKYTVGGSLVRWPVTATARPPTTRSAG